MSKLLDERKTDEVIDQSQNNFTPRLQRSLLTQISSKYYFNNFKGLWDI